MLHLQQPLADQLRIGTGHGMQAELLALRHLPQRRQPLAASPLAIGQTLADLIDKCHGLLLRARKR